MHPTLPPARSPPCDGIVMRQIVGVSGILSWKVRNSGSAEKALFADSRRHVAAWPQGRRGQDLFRRAAVTRLGFDQAATLARKRSTDERSCAACCDRSFAVASTM